MQIILAIGAEFLYHSLFVFSDCTAV